MARITHDFQWTQPQNDALWEFENRIGEAGAKAIFDGVTAQLLQKGFLVRGGQIIDATLVPAPRQHFTRDDKEPFIQEGLHQYLNHRRVPKKGLWAGAGAVGATLENDH